MGKMITGSVDLTKMIEQAKSGHSAFRKAKNGNIYVNLLVWENDKPDQFGNNFSVQLNAEENAPDTERKIYVGNLKHAGARKPEANELPSSDDFSNVKSSSSASKDDGGDLPF